jgi:hypothetical protein
MNMDTSADSLTAFLAEHTTRLTHRGLGAIQVRSNLAESAQAMAVSQAARNLLSKARRDLAAGRSDRAAQYIDRALGLPFDEMAEANAAVHGAHMILHMAMTEALETCDEGDATWLDAAETVLPRCGAHAREDLLETLRVIDHDYRIQPAERRRIRRIAPGDGLVNGRGDVMMTRADDDQATQRQVVFELLHAAIDYETTFRHPSPPTSPGSPTSS